MCVISTPYPRLCAPATLMELAVSFRTTMYSPESAPAPAAGAAAAPVDAAIAATGSTAAATAAQTVFRKVGSLPRTRPTCLGGWYAAQSADGSTRPATKGTPRAKRDGRKVQVQQPMRRQRRSPGAAMGMADRGLLLAALLTAIAAGLWCWRRVWAWARRG